MWYLVHEFVFKTALVTSGPGWWEKKIRQLGVCVPSWTEADDIASGCVERRLTDIPKPFLDYLAELESTPCLFQDHVT